MGFIRTSHGGKPTHVGFRFFSPGAMKSSSSAAVIAPRYTSCVCRAVLPVADPLYRPGNAPAESTSRPLRPANTRPDTKSRRSPFSLSPVSPLGSRLRPAEHPFLTSSRCPICPRFASPFHPPSNRWQTTCIPNQRFVVPRFRVALLPAPTYMTKSNGNRLRTRGIRTLRDV